MHYAVMDPKAQYFYWTVPNLPTNTAVLDIRFGCEGWYPENYAPQPALMFTIATSTVPSYEILPARSGRSARLSESAPQTVLNNR